eukprot:scaffold14.g1134.t1
MARERIPVWLDCDPGHDDAMAIILAGHHPGLDLLGISTMSCNQTVEKTTENALRVLYAAGLSHVDVVMGQHKPLLRAAPLLCAEIHGESGLDGPLGGPVLPPAPGRAAVPGKAPIVMAKRILRCYEERGRQHKVRVIATGALTNVALLLSLFPEVLECVEVAIMGGCLGLGNTGAVVEFNIQTDPEAAKIVFESGVPLAMVPLEVTHNALATTSVLQRIRTHAPSPFLEMVVELLMFFADTARAMHMAVKRLRVDVETCSTLSAGQTVVDVWHQSAQPKNCDVCMKMDVEEFWNLMIAAVHAADKVSPLNTPKGAEAQLQAKVDAKAAAAGEEAFEEAAAREAAAAVRQATNADG